MQDNNDENNKPKNKPGCKGKITEELVERIGNYIKAGNYARTACQACGISEDTFYNWLKWGERDKKDDKTDSLYVVFFDTIKKARAEAEMRNVMLIQKASQDTWQAAAWWLERTNYREWGRTDKHEVDHKGLNIKIEYAD